MYFKIPGAELDYHYYSSLGALDYHVLPDGFVKIRYFGFLAHRNKKRCIALIRKLIDPKAEPAQKRHETVVDMMLRLTGIDITRCPQCGIGKMVAAMPLARI